MDAGESKGDGEYWIDPEKNRNPLLVYCDITTDGGKSTEFFFFLAGPSGVFLISIYHTSE